MSVVSEFPWLTCLSFSISPAVSPTGSKHSFGPICINSASRLENWSLSVNSDTSSFLASESTYPTPTTFCPSTEDSLMATTPTEEDISWLLKRTSSNWARLPGEPYLRKEYKYSNEYQNINLDFSIHLFKLSNTMLQGPLIKCTSIATTLFLSPRRTARLEKYISCQ